jgi:hypothetical protein
MVERRRELGRGQHLAYFGTRILTIISITVDAALYRICCSTFTGIHCATRIGADESSAAWGSDRSAAWCDSGHGSALVDGAEDGCGNSDNLARSGTGRNGNGNHRSRRGGRRRRRTRSAGKQSSTNYTAIRICSTATTLQVAWPVRDVGDLDTASTSGAGSGTPFEGAWIHRGVGHVKAGAIDCALDLEWTSTRLDDLAIAGRAGNGRRWCGTRRGC